jgi:hypothetical protein
VIGWRGRFVGRLTGGWMDGSWFLITGMWITTCGWMGEITGGWDGWGEG